LKVRGEGYTHTQKLSNGRGLTVRVFHVTSFFS